MPTPWSGRWNGIDVTAIFGRGPSGRPSRGAIPLVEQSAPSVAHHELGHDRGQGSSGLCHVAFIPSSWSAHAFRRIDSLPWTFGIGRPTSDLQPRPRGAGVSSWSPGRCDAAIDGFFGSTAIRLNCATAVPGILAACIPDSVLIAASESPPLPPGARSAGQTLTPSDGSVPRPSAGASRVDSRLAGAHALRYRHETGIARRSGRRASRL